MARGVRNWEGHVAEPNNRKPAQVFDLLQTRRLAHGRVWHDDWLEFSTGFEGVIPFPLTFASAMLLSEALLARRIPALRATRVDPMMALRCD